MTVIKVCWTCQLTNEGPEHSCLLSLMAEVKKQKALNKNWEEENIAQHWRTVYSLILFFVGGFLAGWVLKGTL